MGEDTWNSFHSIRSSLAALAGHALTLVNPEEYDEKYKKWDKADLPIYFNNWKKKPLRDKEDLIKEIKEAAKQSNYIINAGDIDDEGQLLVQEVIDYIGYKGPVKRLNTSDLSSAAISKAFNKLDDNAKWYNVGQSAYAREVCDKSFGYTMTRFFTLNNNAGNVVHVGRVKLPTLGLVVDRCHKIDDHIETKYYILSSNIQVNNDKGIMATCTCTLEIDKDSSILKDGKVLDVHFLKDVRGDIKDKEFKGALIHKKETEAPPLPFNRNELNKYAAKKFKYSPKDVMEITQTLRDDFKAITYNRTNSQYLTMDHYREAPETAAMAMENLHMELSLDFNIRSKAFNDENVTAHHGIIPTQTKFDINKLNEKQKNIYEAICRFYFAQFMPSCEKEKVTLSVPVNKEMKLSATVSKVKIKGYREIIDIDEKAFKNEVLFDLPDGEYVCEPKEIFIDEKMTKPPKYYTKTSLEDDMTKIAKYVTDPEIQNILKRKDDGKKAENGSIGTDATRTAIIETLISQGYIDDDKGSLKATKKASELIAQLPQEITAADITANWWAIQEDIAAGKQDASVLIDSVLDEMRHIMETSQPIDIGDKKAHKIQGNIIGKCPVCGSNIKEINNQKLQAYICDNQICHFILWKRMFGGTLNVNNAKKLLSTGTTGDMTFKTKDGVSYKSQLRLMPDHKIEKVK